MPAVRRPVATPGTPAGEPRLPTTPAERQAWQYAIAAKANPGKWVTIREAIQPRQATFVASNIRTGKIGAYTPAELFQVRITGSGDTVNVVLSYWGDREPVSDTTVSAPTRLRLLKNPPPRKVKPTSPKVQELTALAYTISQAPGRWALLSETPSRDAAANRAARVRTKELSSFNTFGTFDAVVAPTPTGNWAVWVTVKTVKKAHAPDVPPVKVKFIDRHPPVPSSPRTVLEDAAAKTRRSPGRWTKIRDTATLGAAKGLASRIRSGKSPLFAADATGRFEADIQPLPDGTYRVRAKLIPAT